MADELSNKMVIITAGTWWYFHVQSVSIFPCGGYLLSIGSSLQAQGVWKQYIHYSQIKRPVKLTGIFPLPDHHLTIRKHQWMVHFSWRLSSHCKLSLLEKKNSNSYSTTKQLCRRFFILNTKLSFILYSLHQVNGQSRGGKAIIVILLLWPRYCKHFFLIIEFLNSESV